MTTESEPRLDPATDTRLDRIWQQAYAARTRGDLQRLYAEWAATYDADHEAVGFVGHWNTARLLAKYAPFAAVANVLDAGCGTGAAGVALHKLGFDAVTGVDFSREMLAAAQRKRVYRHLHELDLGLPLDPFPCNHFDAAVLVGVFSFGQAPAHALDEIVRLVKPGGIVAFTLRADFFEQDAMGVRSRMEQLDRAHAWKLLELSEPEQYLPHKEPEAMYRVWCYRVLETKTPPVDEAFAAAVREALMARSPIKRIDHAFIWNSMASRLYDRYTECPEYYLTDVEVEILAANAPAIVDQGRLLVELGCGSAKKVCHLLAAATAKGDARPFTYTPVDVSQGAVAATHRDVAARFGDRIDVVPRVGRFDEVLASVPVDQDKLIVFFGGSLGNFETLADTVAFLGSIRSRMSGDDRFVVGIDLDKGEHVLRAAYEAGPRNRSFFLNMVRRINRELGGNFDLAAFQQDSPYEPDVPFEGLQTRTVQLRLVTERPQCAYLSALHMEAQLDAGDAIQVGTSRKFSVAQIARLGELAGLRLQRQWFDERRFFSLNEFVRVAEPA